MCRQPGLPSGKRLTAGNPLFPGVFGQTFFLVEGRGLVAELAGEITPGVDADAVTAGGRCLAVGMTGTLSTSLSITAMTIFCRVDGSNQNPLDFQTIIQHRGRYILIQIIRFF